MTQPGDNPFQSPKKEWTKHDQWNAEIASEEFMAGLVGAAAMTALGVALAGIALMCVLQIIYG